MFSHFKRFMRGPVLLGCAAMVSMAPALAQTANFGSLTLGTNSTSASANGNTAGFFSLSNIAPRDRNGDLCLGYAAENPDHILTLQQDYEDLTVQIDSGGNDTTLLIQGPDNNTIRCGSDTSRRNPDANVVDSGWRAGTYRIWVGSHHQNQRYEYTITVSP
ncbi:hypothetical protein XM38_044080 [Halomicronema hongdechloris C2206]|uniref:Peptidase C-terminal archaeal/bacterial domain-containing protein n=1 Tax=Halomicronema hongdechloris C2206 TaxID=1641165 RepID=A0A1Z3HSZ0_9CYAN|nr:hypothetical protein [Halomicronema hongdechloris]ASC73441.1 hypothetical protein XM38_044080 [Halomicronema hongdechloris C2206]